MAHIECCCGSFVIFSVSGQVLLRNPFFLFFLSFSIYCLALAFEHYRQVYIVHSGLQDESLQVTISKLP